MGKRYDVPSSLTIQKAMEYAGYKLIRGCGCRGGACGACGTVYRFPGSFKIEVALACQTVVLPNMHIAQIPFFPAPKAGYDVGALSATAETIGALYPDLYKCMGCNTCTKSCPMEIPVMEYISAALRGDLEQVAELSFSCVMCGLCTARCPAELRQYHIAELARRIVAIHMRKPAPHLPDVVKKCGDGYHAAILDEAIAAPDQWRKLYVEREIEPMNTPETWEPESKKGL
jgi:heterodisulfide reductase subunit C